MTIPGKEMLKRYLRDGWKIDRIKGSHHFLVKGEEKAVIPVHSKDMKKGIEKYLLKRLEEGRK